LHVYDFKKVQWQANTNDLLGKFVHARAAKVDASLSRFVGHPLKTPWLQAGVARGSR